ncbi:radical SAM protein [Methanocella sp. CWC-04]|uniref:Radical SAM protein n=1 Tax=Methanooceanicella nereidis TaxID=2052831 RepID=A0AAP2W6M0_9EURY|nr:radical SAM protein [Methanocella sp. CWC-04]MCD1295483.1 radical SAM protein [Methanocella sp. CWC-04]
MLKRYKEILQGAPARHTLLKMVEVDNEFYRLDDDGLWALHDDRIKEYRDLLETAEIKGHGLEPKSTLLNVKIEIAKRMLKNCYYCEVRCGADRYVRPGACGVDFVSRISSEFLHYGEEPELVPSHTIFFEGCNLKCVYCQNWQISTMVSGPVAEPKRLCEAIERRHRQGSRNVNFVGGDPIPHLHTVLETIDCTRIGIPMIWNSNMYMTTDTMKLLEGAIDVYLADFRYGNDEHALKYSKVKNYWGVVTRNFLEAQCQAEVLVRQLVLPGHVECCTRPIIAWCAENLGRGVRFNLMFQYRPEYRAEEYPEIDRPLTMAEIRRATEIAKEYGLTDLV